MKWNVEVNIEWTYEGIEAETQEEAEKIASTWANYHPSVAKGDVIVEATEAV